jgi:hypothetical protein
MFQPSRGCKLRGMREVHPTLDAESFPHPIRYDRPAYLLSISCPFFLPTLDFHAQRPQADAQGGGGAQAMALEALQGAEDDLLFDLGEGSAGKRAGQIAVLERVVLAEQEDVFQCSLDRDAELISVNGIGQKREGVALERFDRAEHRCPAVGDHQHLQLFGDQPDLPQHISWGNACGFAGGDEQVDGPPAHLVDRIGKIIGHRDIMAGFAEQRVQTRGNSLPVLKDEDPSLHDSHSLEF